MNEPFINPWLKLPPDSVYKTSFVVSAKAHSDLSRCYRSAGIMQTVVAILVEKLIHSLESHNITDYDPATFQRAVADCTIVLGLQRSTSSSPSSGPDVVSSAQTNHRNDSGGVECVARNTTGSQMLPDVSVPPSGGGGNSRKANRKRKEAA